MISILAIVILVVALVLVARRSSKNRDTILIEVLLGLAGSVLAAVAVASFPKLDTDNFLGYLDNQIYELVFGKKGDEAPATAATETGAPEATLKIEKNIGVDDRKLEGIYAGRVRSIRNGSEVLSEKAYILRVDPVKDEKVIEIYQGGDIEYRIRIDGAFEDDGVTWVGETKSVLQGEGFVQDDLKLLLSPEIGRIDWRQQDKVQRIESIGTLHRIDEDTVSERIRAMNRIKNTIFICKEEGAERESAISQFLFIPLEARKGGDGSADTLSLKGLASAGAVYSDIIAGAALPYEGPYELHIKTRFKSNEFPNLTGMNRVTPDLSSFIGMFDKDVSIGINRPGQAESWFKESLEKPEPCRVFFVDFPAGHGASGHGVSGQGASGQGASARP